MKRTQFFGIVIALGFVSSALGQAVFTASPGDWDVPGNWDIGSLPGDGVNAIVGDGLFAPNAEANITGALSEPIIGDLRIAADGNGSLGNINSVVNHSDGSLTTTGEAWSFIAADGPSAAAPNIGTYNLSGNATFTTGGGSTEFHVGSFGLEAGASQGFLNVADNATMNLNRVYIGANTESEGTVTQTGGAINVGSWMAIGREGDAVGTYNMSGGSLTLTSDFLTIGENSGANGTMNVSGSAQISSPNIAVGRFASLGANGDAATGLLTITGDSASIATGALWVGIDNEAGVGGSPSPATGTISFTSSTSVSPILVSGDVTLNDGTTTGSSTLEIDLTGSSATGDVLLISVGGSLNGTFSNLAEGDMVPNSGGRTLTYMGGDGNDIVLLGSSTDPDGDFNMDGNWDCADIDALTNAIATGSTDLSFDMNGDMAITLADITDADTGWLAVGGANNPDETTGNAFLVGDANLDGFVDGLDFIEWNTNKFTATTEWCFGNFNADTVVDGLDFIEWNTNKFMGSADGVAVPEPTAGVLCLFGALLLSRGRRG